MTGSKVFEEAQFGVMSANFPAYSFSTSIRSLIPGDSDVGDNVMLVTICGCWRLNFDVCDIILILMATTGYSHVGDIVTLVA